MLWYPLSLLVKKLRNLKKDDENQKIRKGSGGGYFFYFEDSNFLFENETAKRIQ